MAENKTNNTDLSFLNEEYQYDFKTDASSIFTTGKGLNE